VRVQEMFGVKAEEKSLAPWKPVGKTTDPMVEEAYREYVGYLTKKGDVAALKAIELERVGGPCHYCNVPFKRVEVKNSHGDFAMFEPACHCYKRCDRVVYEATVDKDGKPVAETKCGRWMVEERFKNLSRCIVCYGEPRKEVPRKESSPRRRSRGFHDAKAAAAGERTEEGESDAQG